MIRDNLYLYESKLDSQVDSSEDPKFPDRSIGVEEASSLPSNLVVSTYAKEKAR